MAGKVAEATGHMDIGMVLTIPLMTCDLMTFLWPGYNWRLAHIDTN